MRDRTYVVCAGLFDCTALERINAGGWAKGRIGLRLIPKGPGSLSEGLEKEVFHGSFDRLDLFAFTEHLRACGFGRDEKLVVLVQGPGEHGMHFELPWGGPAGSYWGD